MTEYVPGALSALLADEELPIKRKETPSKVKSNKNASQKRIKSPNDSGVPLKKVKISKKKSPSAKQTHAVQASESKDDSDSVNEMELSPSAEKPSQAYSAGVMKLKPKKVENPDIKIKRLILWF